MARRRGFGEVERRVSASGAVTHRARYAMPDGTRYSRTLATRMDAEAWLVDWNGKLLKTVSTQSRNTSGMAYGGGCVWMGANAEPFGIFQVDMNAKQLSHRQIPLSIDGNGGGCQSAAHGEFVPARVSSQAFT